MKYDVPELLVESYRRETALGREFKIVADLSRTDDRTLDVSYESNEVAFEVELYDGYPCERGFIVPYWADTKTTQAVLNNGILTITVYEQ
jgi:HSP20 family molecular chaperone IbpA